jgi:tetratricopeptide (TPR) repeat protein
VRIALLPHDAWRQRSRLWCAIAKLTVHTYPRQELLAATTSVSLARRANDREALANALIVHADALSRSGAFAAAETALREAESMLTPDDEWMRLWVLYGQVFRVHSMGDLDAASQGHEKLRQTQVRLGNLDAANGALLNLAEIEHQRGRTQEAVSLVQEALAYQRASRNPGYFEHILANLAGYLVALDRLSEARDVALETVRSESGAGRYGMLFTAAVECSALIAALHGDVGSGAQLAGYTEAAFRRIGFERGYTEQTTRTRLEAVLVERLAPAEREKFSALGTALSPQDAGALVLSNLAV